MARTFTPESFARHLNRMAANQVPFATSKAINETAKDFQKVQTAHIRKEFIERNPIFIKRAVKIKPFANKRRLSATVQIEPPGGQRTTDILSKFEEGGTKRPRQGRHLAIPIEVRRTKRGIVSKAQRPRAFQFREIGKRIVGLKRTFIVPGVGILQRRGKRKVRLLYAFARAVPIPAALDFVENAKRVVRVIFPRRFRKAFQQAMRTAR